MVALIRIRVEKIALTHSHAPSLNVLVCENGSQPRNSRILRRRRPLAAARVLRVARTLADLEGADGVRRLHVAEALSYRRLRALN